MYQVHQQHPIDFKYHLPASYLAHLLFLKHQVARQKVFTLLLEWQDDLDGYHRVLQITQGLPNSLSP